MTDKPVMQGKVAVDSGLILIGDPGYWLDPSMLESISKQMLSGSMHVYGLNFHIPSIAKRGFIVRPGDGDGWYRVYTTLNERGKVAKVEIVFDQDYEPDTKPVEPDADEVSPDVQEQIGSRIITDRKGKLIVWQGPSRVGGSGDYIWRTNDDLFSMTRRVDFVVTEIATGKQYPFSDYALVVNWMNQQYKRNVKSTGG